MGNLCCHNPAKHIEQAGDVTTDIAKSCNKTIELETLWLEHFREMVQHHFFDANSKDVEEAVSFFSEKMTADHQGLNRVVESYSVLNSHLENISGETKAVNNAMKELEKAQKRHSDAENDLQKASATGGPKKNEAEHQLDVATKNLGRMKENHRVAKNNLEQTKKPHLKEGLHIMLQEMRVYHEAKVASIAASLDMVAAIDTEKFDVMQIDGSSITNKVPTMGSETQVTTM